MPVSRRPSVASRWREIALDAAGLAFSLRGYEWNWSTSLKMPPYTRPLDLPSAFVLRTLVSLVAHLSLLDTLLTFGLLSDPKMASAGGSIYDPSSRAFGAILSTLFCIHSHLREFHLCFFSYRP
ncbi:hypothetical protein C8J57DRAFT_139905 [Mycena rebaudengoi]|nr:hypothetical protein C8J57DRAFT_139905 [Mycena rebaudengoi]